MSPKHFGIHNLDIVLSVTETVVLSESLEEAGGTEGDKQHGGTLPARYLVGYMSFPASSQPKEDTIITKLIIWMTKLCKINTNVAWFDHIYFI